MWHNDGRRRVTDHLTLTVVVTLTVQTEFDRKHNSNSWQAPCHDSHALLRGEGAEPRPGDGDAQVLGGGDDLGDDAGLCSTTTTTTTPARRTISHGCAASLALALLLVLVLRVGVATAPTTNARAQTRDNRQGQTRADTVDRAGAPSAPAQTGALSPADRAGALAVVAFNAPYGAPDAAVADNAPYGASSRGPYDAPDAAPDAAAVAAAERTSDDTHDAARAGRYNSGHYSSGAPSIGGYGGYGSGGGGDCGGGVCGAYFFKVETIPGTRTPRRRAARARLDHHFSAARTSRDASSRRRAVAPPPRARAHRRARAT